MSNKTKLIQVRGAGGGKGGGGDSFEADDNMYARQSAAFIDAIAEGPIKGLVYGDGSILVDEVRLRDVDLATGLVSNNSNFNNFTMVTRQGTADQTVDASFFSDYPTASYVQDIGSAELLLNEPQSHTISSGTFEKSATDYIKITISTTGMTEIRKTGDDKGDIHTTYVRFNIGFWWVDNDGVLTKKNIFRTGFEGKVSGKYAHTFGFNIEEIKAINGMTDWSIRVERVGGAVSNDDYERQNSIYVDSIEASISDKLTYPYTAYIGGVIDAEQFNSIPSRGYEIDGKLINVPSNHFPIDYNGRRLTMSSVSGFDVGDILSQTLSVTSLTAAGDAESGYTATGTVAAHGIATGKTFTATIDGVSAEADFWEGEFVCTAASATTFTYQLLQPWDASANSGEGDYKTLSSTTAAGTKTAALFSGGIIDKIDSTNKYLYVRNIAANNTALTGALSESGGNTGTITASELALIPANYRRHVTTGVLQSSEQDWDGNYWNTWCNNPAWVYNDLVTNKIYGLGNYLGDEQVNKWELFQIARYCDELVPAGVEAADLLSIHCTDDANYIPSGSTGNHEPRFSANLVIGGKNEAYKVLNDVTSMFRGMTYWLNGEAYLVQDSEKDPVYQFTNGNVIDGMFKYEGTSNKTRTNSITVSWNNPQDYYRKRVEIVELEDVLQKDDEFIKPESTTAFGCTSRGQARRLGKWKLLTNNWNTNTVSFSTSLNAAFLRPGDIVEVIDKNKTGKSWGGRVSTGSSTTAINLDRKPTGFGSTSVESGYAAGDYMLTCSFVGYKTLLAQDQAVINIGGSNTTLLRGAEITQTGDGSTAITTEELSKQVNDTNGDLVFTQWVPFHYTETKTVSAVSNSGKTLTVSSAFSEAPTNEQVWILSRAALATGKTKLESDLFRVMSMVESGPNEVEITALEYNATKFDAVDKNEALTQYRDYFLPDSLAEVPAPTNLDLTPRIVREGHQNVNELVFDWDPALKSDGTPYRFIRGYDVEYSFNNTKWYHAGMSHNSDIEIRGITSGTYYVRVYTVSLQSKRSAPLKVGPITIDYNRVVAPSEADIGLAPFILPGMGNISTDFSLNSGKISFENTNFYHNDGKNEHAVTSQAQLDFSGLGTAAGTRGAENVGYVYFDHSASAFIAVAHDEVANQFYVPGSNTFATATGTLTADPASAASKWGGLDSTNFDGELVLGNTFSFTNNSVTYYHKPKRFASDTEMYTHSPARVKIVDGDNQAFNKPTFLADYQNDTIMGKVTRTGSGYTLQKYGNSQGESPYSVNGTNENFGFTAGSDGVVSNESDFTCDFTVKKGTQAYTFASSGTAQNTFGISLQARSGFDNDSDIVINSSSGQITIGDSDMDAVSSATATMRLFDRGRANVLIADRILSFNKSGVGTTGAGANFVFARAASKPSVPTADGLNIPSADIQWYDNPPTGTNLLWASKGTVAAGGTAYTWGAVFQVEGAAVAEIHCYSDVQASNGSSPTKPSSSTYNATTSTLTLNDSNWNTTPPALASDGDSIYQCTALVSGASTATALAVTWTNPVLYQRKTDGAAGRKVAELSIYYALDFTSTNSFTAPSTPSTGTYNFTNKTVASLPSGWTQTRPEIGVAKWVYESKALVTESSTDNVSNAITWGTPSRSGLPSGDVNWVFKRASSQPTSVGTTNWPAVPTNWYDDIANVPSGSDEIWASKGTTTFVDTSGTYTFVTTWQNGVQIEGSTGATGAEGKGTTTVYYLQTGYGIPSTPSSGTDETPGSWILTVPTAASGKTIWFSLGTKPAGSSTWTFTAPQFYMGDLDYTIPGIWEDKWDLDLNLTGLAKLGLSTGDYANASIGATDLYGSGKVWAALPASGATNTPDLTVSGAGTVHSANYTNSTYSASDFNIEDLAGYADGTYKNSSVTYAELVGTKPPSNANAYTLPSGVPTAMSISGTTLTFTTGAGAVNLSTQDTNTTYSAGDFNITGLAGYTAAAYANASVVATATVDGANTVTWSKYATGNYNPNSTSHTWSVTWKDGAGTTQATSTVVANLDTGNTDLNAPTITANATGSGVTSSVSGTGTTSQTITLSRSGFNDVVLKAVIYVVTGFSFKFNGE